MQAKEQDPKLEALATEIQAIRKKEPGANILVYTEYVDSQRAALKALSKVDGLKLISMSGEDDQKTRCGWQKVRHGTKSLILLDLSAG